MGSIYLSFNLKSFSTCAEASKANEVFEKDYQQVYKPAAKFLVSHPNFPFTFSLSGLQLQFYKKRKNEFLKVLKDLQDRNQTEILGGGYYEPIFPLIPTIDRSSQIDLLSSEIRQTLGKRPRGITLFADCWDSSLINTLQTEKIEYVLLESSMIPSNKKKFLPIYMSVLGKSVDILPYYDGFIPEPETTPEDFINKIVRTVEKAIRKENPVQTECNRLVNINFDHETIAKLFECQWFEKLSDYLDSQDEPKVFLCTNDKYRHEENIKVSAFIASGINRSVVKANNLKEYSIYSLLEECEESKKLYSRMLYLSMLINSYKADKQRKKAAREKLNQAQSGYGYICENGDLNFLRKNRHQTYKLLMEAQKLLRDGEKFTEYINCFDYTNNGIDEYLCSMNNYFAYISLISGAVQNLEIVKNTGNYADNLKRNELFDGYTDDYERGLFVDHVLNSEQFENYLEGKAVTNGIFSRVRYKELKYNQKHFEIQLCSEAVLPETKQKIFLRKKYFINSNGFMVQYIIKNESNKNLNVKLAVESNIAQTLFNHDNVNNFAVELVDEYEIKKLDSSKSSAELNKSGKLNKVDIIRVTDTENGISFGFEPNEECGYFYMPLMFRGKTKDDKIENIGCTSVSTLYWDINLEPDKETEKTINFTITSVKKVKKTK